MKLLPFILFVLALPLGISSVSGQEEKIRFEHLTKASGLSQSTVYSIAQDKYGFMWFGTADGLNRYDGYNLKKYFHDSEKPNSLANNRIYNLLIDSDGDLWVATLGGGLNRYRVETDDFIAYRNSKKNRQSINQDIVMSLFEDKDGFIWVGTAEGGLNKFDRRKGIFKSYTNDPTNPSSIGFTTVSSIAGDRNGCLWLGSNKAGLDMFNPLTGVFVHYTNDPGNKNSLSSNRINQVFVDSRGLVWISTNDGLNILDPTTSKFKRLYPIGADARSLKTNDIHCVFEDRNQNIWVGTYGGLSLLKKEDFDSFQFQNYFNNPLDLSSLSNDLVRCIYQDRSGLIWVGNFSSGIDRFDPNPSAFKTFRGEANNATSLSNNIVRSFMEDKEGKIWIGTFGGGLNRFDPTSHQFQSFRHTLGEKNSLAIDFINSICADDRGILWIGTYGGGLDRYNPQTHQFKHYKNDPKNSRSISNDYIRTMLFDSYGFLWIATSGGGLSMFDPRKEEFVSFLSDRSNPMSISDNRVMGLLEDYEGNIWVGSSSHGLNKYSRSKNSFEHFRNNPTNPNSISSDRIYCIYQQGDLHTLWVGTGNGLNRFNRKDSTFTRFTKKDGLPSDVILGILEDKRGYLWISTIDGLCKFDPRGSGLLKVYDEKAGLQANEFSESAYFKDSRGNLYFGGLNGFSVFNPEKIKDNPVKPSTYIVDFQLFNKSVGIDSNSILKQNIILTNEIHLNYSDYVFLFEFAALNFNNPDKNSYRYKMDGFDKEWITVDSKRRFATYTNLDPGEYTFMVKASNNDGVWNETSTDIRIFIDPPFWNTWWFRFLFVALFIFSLLVFFRWRVARLNRQKKQLEHIIHEKTMEVVEQKEELATTNEELSVVNEDLMTQREELQAALDELHNAQQQLIQSEKMASLGVLSAGIAHEINNPLNFIHGGVLGIDNYFKDNPPESLDEVSSFIEAINVGVDRASQIVTSLTHYSRRDDLPQGDCDIHAIIDNCLIMLQSQFKAKVAVVKQYTPKPHTVYGNEGKLHQAILNILANAEQSMEETGTITVRTDGASDFVSVTITDSGCGISPENIRNIFDPFFTTKAPGKGTGLGLSITYNIIQEHCGTIDFQSQLGEGTTVIVKLPMNKAD